MSEWLDSEARTDAKGIYLLFANGQRPDAAAIRRFVSQHKNITISLDPVAQETLQVVDDRFIDQRRNHDVRSPVWVELLQDGLTFDLIGLAPGEGTQAPPIETRIDCDQSISDVSANSLQLVVGEHLSGAEGTMPVLKGLLRLSRDLVQHFEQICSVIWPHSESGIGRRFFESSTTAFLEGGAFPALGLTAFRAAIDGGLQSVGLAHFIGQELRIEPELANERIAATRLGVRLINQLVLSGPLSSVEQVVAPDGSLMTLEPSANGRFIRVRSR